MGCILTLIWIVRGASPKWWLLVGVFAGLGLENKPSMTFFLVALVFGLLVTPQRRLLWNRWFAAGDRADDSSRASQSALADKPSLADARVPAQWPHRKQERQSQPRRLHPRADIDPPSAQCLHMGSRPGLALRLAARQRLSLDRRNLSLLPRDHDGAPRQGLLPRRHLSHALRRRRNRVGRHSATIKSARLANLRSSRRARHHRSHHLTHGARRCCRQSNGCATPRLCT